MNAKKIVTLVLILFAATAVTNPGLLGRVSNGVVDVIQAGGEFVGLLLDRVA